MFRLHPEVFDKREGLVEDKIPLFDFSLVRYVRDVAESKALNALRGPAVIIAAAAWRSRAGSSITWPTASAITAIWSCSSASRRSTRSAGGSRAARRSSGSWARSTPAAPRWRPSAATRPTPTATELRAWVRRLGGPIRRAFVVHGEPPALGAMATILREEGVREVVLPKHGEAFDL